jgi:hypothetical protein
MVGTRSLSSGAHSRDPVALPTLYDCGLICFAHKRVFNAQPATNQHDGQIT